MVWCTARSEWGRARTSERKLPAFVGTSQQSARQPMRDGVGTYTYTCTCTHHRGARVRGAEVSHSEEASLGTRSRTRRQRTINSVGDELFGVGDHIVATLGGL